MQGSLYDAGSLGHWGCGKYGDSRRFLYHTRVQFDHTDAQGRVFYAHYFRLLDQARCAYWEALGFSENDVRQIEHDTVIVHVEADYLGPCVL